MADTQTIAQKAVAKSSANDGFNVTTLQQFFQWWKTHLWDSLPHGVRKSWLRNSRPLMISLADDAIWPERSELAKPYKISQTTLLSGNPEKLRDVTLVMGDNNGLRRKVELPLAVEGRLAQVLSYELDRLTPLRADELYFDFRLLSRNATRGVCLVELLAAPKSRANEIIANAKAIGANVTRIVLAASDVDDGIDLLHKPMAEGADRDVKRWITPGLVALCALLAIALVTYPIYKKRQQVIAMLPLEASARADAEAASIVGRQLEKQLTEYNHVLKRKHASPIVVQVLEDMTKRMPEDTWAQTFEIKATANAPAGQHPREIIVQGETGSGGKLLQLVQESTLIKDPVLKAAMTRVSPTAERFHFAGELVAVAAPPALSLADAGAALSAPIQVTPNAPAGAPAQSASKQTSDLPSAPAAEKAPVKPADSAVQPPAVPPKNAGPTSDSAKKSTSAINPVVPQYSGANASGGVTPSVSGGVMPTPTPSANPTPGAQMPTPPPATERRP